MVITRHAKRRIRERIGLAPSAHLRAAEAAWAHGKSMADADGWEYQAIRIVVDERPEYSVRVHNGLVWVFAGRSHEALCLVTVYAPNESVVACGGLTTGG